MAGQTIQEMMWDKLQSQIKDVNQKTDQSTRQERAEVADGIPAYTLATAPLAAQGGLGNGATGGYITVAWISDGRKSGEGVGTGTGILAFYNTTTDSWFGVRSELAVTV